MSEDPEVLSPIVAELIDLFGPAPVLSTENIQSYYNSVDTVARELSPQTHLGKWYVRLIADTIWENMRFMRHKVLSTNRKVIVLRATRAAIKAAEQRRFPIALADAFEIACTPADGDGAKLMSAEEYDESKALTQNMEHYEKLDKLVQGTLVRVSGLYREYEELCEGLDARLREKLNQARLDAVIEEKKETNS